jgi:hypothetical protein
MSAPPPAEVKESERTWLITADPLRDAFTLSYTAGEDGDYVNIDCTREFKEIIWLNVFRFRDLPRGDGILRVGDFKVDLKSVDAEHWNRYWNEPKFHQFELPTSTQLWSALASGHTFIIELHSASATFSREPAQAIRQTCAHKFYEDCMNIWYREGYNSAQMSRDLIQQQKC